MATSKTPVTYKPSVIDNPLPWRVDNDGWLVDSVGNAVRVKGGPYVELIARAVSCHQELLEALDKSIAYLANPQAFDKEELGKAFWALKEKAESGS